MFERHHLIGSDFFNSQNLPLKVLERNPQPPYPLHTHDFTELVVVFSGEGTHFTRENSFPVKTGDVFVIKGDMAHGYKNLNNLVLVNILFDLRKLHIPLYDLGRSTGYHAMFTVDPVLRKTGGAGEMLNLSNDELIQIRQIIPKLSKAAESETAGSDFQAVYYFMDIVYKISKAYDTQYGNDTYTSPQRIAAALSYIENTFMEPISNAELMEISGMSESSLLRAFTRITGLSPGQYVNMVRIQKACTLLEGTDLTVTEIALRTGFSESNYFSRLFSNMIGRSPSSYRRERSAGKD